MASFEKRSDVTLKKSSPAHKLPLKRFEPAIYRFTKIAIPMDLDRLGRHKYNIEKYVKWKNWNKLDVERNNAERTIKQLKANIHDMNAIREHVAENELSEFDNKVKTLSKKALDAIDTLKEVIEHSGEARSQEDEPVSGNGSLSPQLSGYLSDCNADMFYPSKVETKPSLKQTAQPLLRFEVTLRTFTKITIPTAMERLEQHCHNMDKFYNAKLWHELNSEQVNAAITVKHLKRSIQDIEITRCQVSKDELPEFDKRIGPLYERALTAIDSFITFQKKYKLKDGVNLNQETVSQEDEANTLGVQVQSQNQPLSPDETTLQSWDDLERSLVELNELIHDFSHLVHDQQSNVDTITSNIEHAQVNIQDATQELGMATKLQGAILPAIGAVVGGVIGGPVGMLAGFKAAAVFAAVGGGVLGYGATNYIRQKRDKAVDSELEKLTDTNSDKELKER